MATSRNIFSIVSYEGPDKDWRNWFLHEDVYYKFVEPSYMKYLGYRPLPWETQRTLLATRENDWGSFELSGVRWFEKTNPTTWGAQNIGWTPRFHLTELVNLGKKIRKMQNATKKTHVVCISGTESGDIDLALLAQNGVSFEVYFLKKMEGVSTNLPIL